MTRHERQSSTPPDAHPSSSAAAARRIRIRRRDGAYRIPPPAVLVDIVLHVATSAVVDVVYARMDHEGRTSTSARGSSEEHDDAVVDLVVVGCVVSGPAAMISVVSLLLPPPPHILLIVAVRDAAAVVNVLDVSPAMAAGVVASVRFDISTFGGGGGIIVGGGLGVESRAPFYFYDPRRGEASKNAPATQKLPSIRPAGYRYRAIQIIIRDRT